MKYVMLLWPHANARYQQESRRLAWAELELMLRRVAPEAKASVDEAASWPGLVIECPGPLSPEAVDAIRGHSLLYQLFECREDQSLVPVAGRRDALLGGDLPAILKYKGKTNELFLQLLVNAALYSSDYWKDRASLEFLDPMCGRATAPFIALNLGWNAVGADVDSADLKEAERFFKRYLEYHRFKHHFARESRTLRRGRSAPVARFDVTAPAGGSAGVNLQLIHLDAGQSAEAFPKNRFHLIACDLPYGVRHDAQPGPGGGKGSNWLEVLLKKSLPQWLEVLKPGGALAVSFNAQTLRRDRLRQWMAEAGFEVFTENAYESFEHWVEQAITRDVAVARKAR